MQKTLVSLILFLVVVSSYAKSVHKGKKDEENREQYYNVADFDVIYDQKQNATENYRIDVSGVDVVIAPAASIIQAFLSPLTALALMGGFSKKAALPILRTNLGPKKEVSSEANIIEVTTKSTASNLPPNEVVENQRDFTKNFEEKIQVQELLPGFKVKDEEKNASIDSTKKSETV